MLTSKSYHSAVHHEEYLYVFGGDKLKRDCEMFSCAEHRWEAIPPTPNAGEQMSGVVVEGSLYTLGGRTMGKPKDFIQKLCLDSLVWEVMSLQLPFKGACIPCFKLSPNDAQICFVLKETLYCFEPLHSAIYPITNDLTVNYSSGYSYFSGCYSYCSKGTLYVSSSIGSADTVLVLKANSLMPKAAMLGSPHSA
jgi:hypothetical protein